SFPKLPPQPVKLGDTWKGELALGNQMIGRVSGAVTFTLKSFTGTGAQTAAVVGVAMTVKQDGPGPQGMSLRLGDGKGEGELIFELVNGRIRRSTMRTELPSTITTTGPDGSPVTIKNQVMTTMTMELTDQGGAR